MYSVKFWRRAAVAASLFACVALFVAAWAWCTTSANARAVQTAWGSIRSFQRAEQVAAQNDVSAESVQQGGLPPDTRPYVASHWSELIPQVMPSVVALAPVASATSHVDQNRLWRLPGAHRNWVTRLMTRYHAWRDGPGAENAGERGSINCAGVVVAGHRVLTASHCIDDTAGLQVRTANGEWRGAYIVGADAAQDVAVLGIEGDPLRPIAIAPMSPLQGQDVAVFGSPGGYAFSIGTGVVARYGRDGTMFAPNRFMLVTTPIHGGDSGGVVVNARGEAVSLVSYGFDTYTQTIPIDRALRVAAELERR